MTCIVGLINNDTVYIGADSLESNGYSKVVRKDKKVFKLKNTHNAVIGFTSSFRMGQLLMYATNLLNTKNEYENEINHEYLVTKFIPDIIKLFENGGYGKVKDGEKQGGFFLLGYKDKLFKIESDYQVAESYYSYDACGSGEDLALGSLTTTEYLKDNISPEERIHIALQCATQFTTGVAPPYYILNTKNNEIIKYDN
jgi:ATP-dependent protease HslVU (ClpYQ) peptidase subunit